VSQAAGFRGTPSVGHCFNASRSASCARSSARPKSPTIRVRMATTLPDSMRQTADTVRSTLVAGRTVSSLGISVISLLSALRLLFAPALFLLDPLVVSREILNSRHTTHLQARSGSKRRALRPFRGFFARGDLKNPEAVEQLLRLAIGAIGNQWLFCGEVDDETLGRVREALARHQDTR